MQVGEWNKLQSENKPFMCTARPNWLSLSTTFFNKDACHKIPIPLYDILELNEEKMTVRVEPMVSVGDITKYLIPKGYTLAVTLEIAGKYKRSCQNSRQDSKPKFQKTDTISFDKYLARKNIYYVFAFFADATLGGLAMGVGMTTYSHNVSKKIFI